MPNTTTGEDMRAVLFECEPEDLDADCYIDFEDEAPSDPYVRAAWMGWMVGNTVRAYYDAGQYAWDTADDLVRRVALDEVGVWAELAERLVEAGYGVYNSDTRFEVYLPEQLTEDVIRAEMAFRRGE